MEMQRSYQSYIRLLVGPMHSDGRLVRCWLVRQNFLIKGGKYRVFIKYCVFSLKFCAFSELCQFCCSAGFLPAWCVYTR